MVGDKLTIFGREVAGNLLNNENEEIPKLLSKEVVFNDKLKETGAKFNIRVGTNLRELLKKIIYSWYVDGDHYLLRYILGREKFMKQVFVKCPLCKVKDNSQMHLTNDCVFTLDERNCLLATLRKFKEIYFGNGIFNRHNSEEQKKIIKAIKDFIKCLYKKTGEYRNN